jgi:hypothetical protein
MPIEYYLAAGVALILLVLLVFALTGKKTKRVVVQKNPGGDELTRQVARAAAALEALLVQLKASPPQATTPVAQQAPSRAVAPTRVEQVPIRTAEVVTEVVKPQSAPEPPIPATVVAEPVVTEPVRAEPVAIEEEAQAPQKPRRVKLSMFGR